MREKRFMITTDKLKKIFPNVDKKKCEVYTEAFNKVLPAYGLNSPRRVAAFLGQIAVESGELRYDKELPSKYNKKDPKDPKEPTGTLYEGRKNLGNLNPGDGPKYIGRGILQLTGRANYENMSKKLNIDLVNNPELACTPEISVKIACEYFVERGLLSLADLWNLDKITEKVNGKAKLHLKQRIEYSEKALKELSS
jgi:putative chitinase